MKTYALGTVGDRILVVKKTGGEYVVTIRVKDTELKYIELPPKGEFSSFRSLFMLVLKYIISVYILFYPISPSIVPKLFFHLRVTDGRHCAAEYMTSMLPSRPCGKVAMSNIKIISAGRTTSA